jgi:hypothetical protein
MKGTCSGCLSVDDMRAQSERDIIQCSLRGYRGKCMSQFLAFKNTSSQVILPTNLRATACLEQLTLLRSRVPAV